MSSENRTVVLRWFEEVWNQRLPETIDELMNERSVCYTDQGPMRGSEEFRHLQYTPLTSAFPDLHVDVDGIVEEGDDVVVRWTAHGTHSGEGVQIPPTHKRTTFTGISWIRVRNGKLEEGWQHSDITDVIRRLAEPAPVA